MALDLGTKVYYRASDADGGAVSMALVTAAIDDETVSLAVKPNQAPWIDAANVKLLGSQEVGAACWSAWPFQA